jgi:hypothetical protein
MARTYQELRSYSPIQDCTVARISMTDDRHQEFFMLVPDRGTRRDYRAARSAALEALQEAIDAGCEPGEVRVDPAAWAEMITAAMLEGTT